MGGSAKGKIGVVVYFAPEYQGMNFTYYSNYLL